MKSNLNEIYIECLWNGKVKREIPDETRVLVIEGKLIHWF